MAAEKQRLIWIDYGKGITILFVVIAHVLKGLIEGNLVGDLTFSLTLLNMVIFTFIMPVFFALSGYLYRPVTNVKDFFRQIKKRAISLLIPYLIFSVLFVLLQHLSSSGINNLISWNSLLFIFIKPITYLWYLYALFLIFLLFDFLSLLRISAGFSFALAIIAVSLAAILPIPEPLIFVFRWAIFFLIGYVLKVKNSQFSNIYFLMLNVLVFIFSLIIQKNFDPTWAQTNEPTVYNLVSKIVSVPLFFSISNQFQLLKSYFVSVGKDSIIVYLVHVPLASIVRVLLTKIGFVEPILLTFLSLVLVWLVSTFSIWLSHKIRLVDFIFYPNDLLRKKV